jgi:hypothetical protein
MIIDEYSLNCTRVKKQVIRNNFSIDILLVNGGKREYSEDQRLYNKTSIIINR